MKMSKPEGLLLKDVSKSYGDKNAVDSLSISVSRGEIFGLLGPNGAGKTTTLKMIAGLIIPDTGSIELDGSPAHAARDRVCYVPDEPTVFEHLSGREYLLYTGRLRGISRDVLERRIQLCIRVF